MSVTKTGALISSSGKAGITASGKLAIGFTKGRCCCDCTCAVSCAAIGGVSANACAYSTLDTMECTFGTITPAPGASGQPYYNVLLDLIASVSGKTLSTVDEYECGFLAPQAAIPGYFIFMGKTIAETGTVTGRSFAYTWMVIVYVAGACQTPIPGCEPNLYPDRPGFSCEIYLIGFESFGRTVGDTVPCNLVDWTYSATLSLTQRTYDIWASSGGSASALCGEDCNTASGTNVASSSGAGLDYIDGDIDYGSISITKHSYGPTDCQSQPSSLSVPALCGIGGWTLFQRGIGCTPEVYYCAWDSVYDGTSAVIEARNVCEWRMVVSSDDAMDPFTVIATKLTGSSPLGEYIVTSITGTCSGLSVGDTITVT